jgi:hypothetical protein
MNSRRLTGFTPSAENHLKSNTLFDRAPCTALQQNGVLKWSVRKLSDQCGVSESAISRGERVNGTPPMQVRNLNMIRQVFEEHGIEFLGLDGVRLLAQSPELLPRARSAAKLLTKDD